MIKNISIFDPFDWDKDFYTFSRQEKDMTPYSVIQKENKTILVHNVIGLNKEDLNIILKTESHNQILYITGTSQDSITGSKYSISSRFLLKAAEVKTVESEVKNGLLYVTIEYKEPDINEIKIDIK